MSEATLIALTILGGIFALMALAMVKEGIAGAIRMWGVLGVAFGAIVSYYFTNHVKQKEVVRAQAEAERATQSVGQMRLHLEDLAKKAELLADKVEQAPPAAAVSSIRSDPEVAKVLESREGWDVTFPDDLDRESAPPR